MCGICGLVYFDAHRPVDEAELRPMTDTLAHRGPDDEGIFTALGIGLGMRRLSIVDPESGDVVVVFNGEIYNYESLRRLLVSKGHRLRTRSDTEVIVHLYEEFGVECLDYLDGMFAFAIWDARRRWLLLARDRFGGKPLFYATWSGGLVFASEMKAILVSQTPLSTDVDLTALSLYFTFMTVPAPLSILKSVRKLPRRITCCVTRKTILNYCNTGT